METTSSKMFRRKWRKADRRFIKNLAYRQTYLSLPKNVGKAWGSGGSERAGEELGSSQAREKMLYDLKDIRIHPSILEYIAEKTRSPIKSVVGELTSMIV